MAKLKNGLVTGGAGFIGSDIAAHIFVKGNICGLEPGWKPEHVLGKGLLKTVRGYPGHRDWFETNRKQKEYQAWIPKNHTERVEGKK